MTFYSHSATDHVWGQVRKAQLANQTCETKKDLHCCPLCGKQPSSGCRRQRQRLNYTTTSSVTIIIYVPIHTSLHITIMRIPHSRLRLHNIQEDEHDEDERDEKASLLTSNSFAARSTNTSTPAAASTTASHFGSYLEEVDDDDNDWEDISLPTSSLKDRFIYWATWTLPILLYDALRLGLFVLFLAPAFASFFYYYVTADRRVVRYKDSNSMRHVVDVYGAKTCTKKDSNRKPVLVFFTGGAWVIGYKMWGAFLAKVFAAMGVLVVVPDYPNYPFVTVPQMVQDAEAAIQWTLDDIGTCSGCNIIESWNSKT